MKLNSDSVIGIVGAGVMGNDIARLAASYGHTVLVYEVSEDKLATARDDLKAQLEEQVIANGLHLEERRKILNNVTFVELAGQLESCSLVIETVDEDLRTKQKTFHKLERVLSKKAIIATNTSSLSIAAITSPCKIKERTLGLHFFYPAQKKEIIEVIPSLITNKTVIDECCRLLKSWQRTPVISKDTPGFIVNRIRRLYFGEALRIYDEDIAGIAFIDRAMKEGSGLEYGPFELMDIIGLDKDYPVSESIFEGFYYDRKYVPSISEKRLFEAGYFGINGGRGFYQYEDGKKKEIPDRNGDKLSREIYERILSMMINEAASILSSNVAAKEDLETAVKLGLDFPFGLLRKADETGVKNVYKTIKSLYKKYGDVRYMPHFSLKKMAKENKKFFP